jgi:hypothetical protein
MRGRMRRFGVVVGMLAAIGGLATAAHFALPAPGGAKLTAAKILERGSDFTAVGSYYEDTDYVYRPLAWTC